MDIPAIPLPFIVSLSTTDNLLRTLLLTTARVNEIFLSPLALPRVCSDGEMVEARIPNLPPLTASQIARIAHDLIGNRPAHLSRLQRDGSCVFSYRLSGAAEFRVTAFAQRGAYMLVLRVAHSDEKPRPRHMGARLTPNLKSCCSA